LALLSFVNRSLNDQNGAKGAEVPRLANVRFWGAAVARSMAEIAALSGNYPEAGPAPNVAMASSLKERYNNRKRGAR